MCEANAYIVENGKEQIVMESVDIIEPSGPGTWRLLGIFGDQAHIKGRIFRMNLLEHKILFKKTE